MFAGTFIAAFVVLKLVTCANAAEVGKWTGNEFEHNYAMNDMPFQGSQAKPKLTPQNRHPEAAPLQPGKRPAHSAVLDSVIR